jgi:hypothetical protein
LIRKYAQHLQYGNDVTCWWCHASLAILTSPLFWDITRRCVVSVYGRFDTTYRSHLHGSTGGVISFLLGLLAREGGTDTLSRNVGKNYHTTPRNIPEERRSNQLFTRAGVSAAVNACISGCGGVIVLF